MNIAEELNVALGPKGLKNTIASFGEWRVFVDDNGFIPSPNNTFLSAKVIAWKDLNSPIHFTCIGGTSVFTLPNRTSCVDKVEGIGREFIVERTRIQERVSSLLKSAILRLYDALGEGAECMRWRYLSDDCASVDLRMNSLVKIPDFNEHIADVRGWKIFHSGFLPGSTNIMMIGKFWAGRTDSDSLLSVVGADGVHRVSKGMMADPIKSIVDIFWFENHTEQELAEEIEKAYSRLIDFIESED